MSKDSTSRLLDEVSAYPESVYASIDLNRLASFTVHWLQEHRMPTTFENIVVAGFRMFPLKFALEGYSEYPDAARINRALLQLRPKYRNWARGNVQKGFVLTESGLAEVKRVKDALSSGNTETVTKRKSLRPRTMDRTRDLGSIMDSPLFSKWKDKKLGDGTVLELLDMLQAFAYTPPKALNERIEGLENAALQVGRQDIVSFLRDVARRLTSSFENAAKESDMAEYPLQFATRQIRRAFARAIGRSIPKILTELITNADDSYRRLTASEKHGDLDDPCKIRLEFERAKRRFTVTDRAEGLTDSEMKDRFVTYGQESADRSKGFRTRSLFGKGLRDVLFTQQYGQVKSIKDGKFYNCRFRWKDVEGQERPVVEIKPPSRVTDELRDALGIPGNGTLVEFELAEGASNPQPGQAA